MKTSVNRRCVIWLLLFLILLRPTGLAYILNIETITRMLCMLVSTLFFVVCIFQKKITVANALYIAYEGYLLVCTIFNGTYADIVEMISVAICNIGIICFVNYIIFLDFKNGIKAMYCAYFILIISNFAYMLLNPHGYNVSEWNVFERGYYLFGHQNSTITYVMPAICVSLIAGYNRIIKKWQTILLVAISVLSIILVFSATSLVGLFVFFLVYFLMKKSKLKKFLNATGAMILGSALCVGVVFLGIQTYGIAADFITNFLNRSTDFTSRTLIWDKTLDVIGRNWFFGIGYKVNASYQSLIHGSSAHNEYLYMMLQGGIILLVIFYLYFIVLKRPLEKHSTSYVTYVFTALYFSLFIQFIVETHMHRIAPLLALVGCANKIIEESVNNINPINIRVNVNRRT